MCYPVVSLWDDALDHQPPSTESINCALHRLPALDAHRACEPATRGSPPHPVGLDRDEVRAQASSRPRVWPCEKPDLAEHEALHRVLGDLLGPARLNRTRLLQR